MYTLRSQPIFNPMQTTLFKRAHTGTCIDNGYDINSMAALSNAISNANQNLMSNLISSNNTSLIPSTSNNHHHQTTTTSKSNLLDSLNKTAVTTSTTQQVNENLIYDKLALSYYQQLKQLQEMPASLFNVQNSSSVNLNLAFKLATELSASSKSFNQQLQQLPTSTTAQLNRPLKKQKTIPNPIQLAYSNFNPNNEQVQPLDLSIKSASSTNSIEHFILEPLNLSRSNSPEEVMDKSSLATTNKNSNLIKDNSKIVQIQNALCKKKKIMLQRANELLKKSSCSSAPCSPSSIATSSSPSDQPFDLDTSQSNQSNLEICLPIINETKAIVNHLNQLNKKRKLSDSNLDVQINSTNLIQQQSNQQLPKLQAKRRLNKQQQLKTSVNDEALIINNKQQLEDEASQQQQQNNQPNTIIIDAKNTFTCSICGEMFAFKDRLSKHIKSKHRNKSIDSLNQTKSTVTSQQSVNGRNSPKSYICTICNRSFARSDMLTRHSRVHSGVKPYNCDICKQEFTRSDHLATHKRTHSGEKPYKCSKCTYTACRRDMITRHMKTHGDKNKVSVVLLLPSSTTKSTSSSNNNTLLSTINEQFSSNNSSSQNSSNESNNNRLEESSYETDLSKENEQS